VSKARLVITAVVVEGRSQADVARSYAVSKGWVSKLVARYRAEGDTAFEPRSRRPATSPTVIADTTVEWIVGLRRELAGQGLTPGPTPSPGTSNATTISGSRPRRSTAPCAAATG
jgi:hypothetical protein